jgi:hypothetical protein
MKEKPRMSQKMEQSIFMFRKSIFKLGITFYIARLTSSVVRKSSGYKPFSFFIYNYFYRDIIILFRTIIYADASFLMMSLTLRWEALRSTSTSKIQKMEKSIFKLGILFHVVDISSSIRKSSGVSNIFFFHLQLFSRDIIILFRTILYADPSFLMLSLTQ